jgi:hypothetical protein
VRARGVAAAFGGALAFGVVTNRIAALASGPDREWIQWVVNWGSLWLVIPYLFGWGATACLAAASCAGLVASVEVLAYYGPTPLTPSRSPGSASAACPAASLVRSDE